MSLVFFLGATPVYSLALTMPTILNNGFGYDHVKSQLMTVPVYCVAVVCVLITGFAADKLQRRGLLLILTSFIGLVGWIVGVSTPNPHWRYFGCFLSAAGAFSATPCVLTLLSQNLANETKRCTGIALQISVSAMGAILASNIFPASDAPRFKKAHWVSIGCVIGKISITLFYLYAIRKENKRKEERIARGEFAKYTKEELFELGDKNPYFKYRF